MNLLADVGMCHDGFQQRERKVFGVRGGKSHTFDAWHIRDGCDQSCKIPVAESVRIDVLSQECDLLESLLGDPASFLNDSLWIAGTFTSPSVGDHTEAAEVVAASHDGDPGVYPVVSVRYDIVIGFIFRKVDRESLLIQPLFLRVHRVADQHRQLAIGIRAGEHIDQRLNVRQFLFQVLRHTAQDADDQRALLA